MIEAELHDGRILEFPDGTDPAVVQSTVKKVLGESQAQQQPSWPTQILQGANELIAAPARWAESGVGALTGSDARPVSDFLKQTFYPGEAKTPGARIARSAGAMIPETLATAAALPLAAPAKVAGMAARAVPSLRDWLANAMLRPYDVAKPGAAMATDVLGAAGAGAGTQTYREGTADPTFSGELTSGLVGGTAAAGAPAAMSAGSRYIPGVGMAARMGRDFALSNLPPEYLDKIPSLKAAAVAKQEADHKAAMPGVAKEFSAVGTPDAMAGLREADRLRQAVPGFDPTTAEATGLPSLTAAQRAYESQAHGAELDALAGRRTANERALGGMAEQNRPPAAPGLPEDAVAGAVNRRVEGVRDQLVDATGSLVERARNLPERLPAADLETTGKTIRERMLDLRGQESARMSKLAEELGMDDKTWVPFSELRARVKSVVPSQFARGESLGETAQTILWYRPQKGKPPTFQDVKYLREQIGDEIRTAERAGERNKARVMRGVRDQIDAFLDNDVPAKVFQGNVGLQGQYRQFRETYKREFIDRFETGAARDAKRLGADNRFRTADEDVAFDFFGPGNIRGVRDFKRVVGDDPEANKAMQAVIIDSARAASVKDGQVNRKALDKWLTDHQSVLAQFPETRALFDDVAEAALAIEGRRAQLSMRERTAAKTAFAKAAGGQPEKVVDNLLANPRMAHRAINGMADTEKKAFAQIMWDRALGPDGVVDPDKLRSFMATHGGIARRVMSPDHIRALSDLESGWRMLSRVPSPVGKAGQSTPIDEFKKLTGTGPLQISSRVFAASSGRTSPRMVMLDLLTRGKIAASQRHAEEIAKQALYDADFAKKLAAYVRSPQNSPQSAEHARKIRAYVTAAGLDAAAPDEKQDD